MPYDKKEGRFYKERRLFTLGNGLKVLVEVGENSLAFKYGEEWVSYCPSEAKAGMTYPESDRSNLMFYTLGDVTNKYAEQYQ